MTFEKTFSSQCEYYKASGACRRRTRKKRCPTTCEAGDDADKPEYGVEGGSYSGEVTEEKVYSSKCEYYKEQGKCDVSYVERNCKFTCDIPCGEAPPPPPAVEDIAPPPPPPAVECEKPAYTEEEVEALKLEKETLTDDNEKLARDAAKAAKAAARALTTSQQETANAKLDSTRNEARITTLEEQNQFLRDTVAKRETTISGLTERIDGYQKSLDGNTDASAEVAAAKADARRELAAETEKFRNATRTASQLQTALNQKDAELTACNSKGALDSTLDSVADAKAEREKAALQKDLEISESRASEAESEVARLKAEIETLKSDTAAQVAAAEKGKADSLLHAADLAIKHDQLQSSCSDSQRKIQSQAQKIAELEARHETTYAAKQEAVDLALEHREGSAEDKAKIASLEGKVSHLEDDIKDKQAEKEALEAKILTCREEAEADILAAKHKLDVADNKQEDLELRENESEKRLKEATSRAELAEAESEANKEALEKAIGEMLVKHRQTAAKLANFETMREVRIAEIENSWEDKNEARSQADKLRQEQENLQRQMVHRAKMIDATEDALEGLLANVTETAIRVEHEKAEAARVCQSAIDTASSNCVGTGGGNSGCSTALDSTLDTLLVTAQTATGMRTALNATLETLTITATKLETCDSFDETKANEIEGGEGTPQITDMSSSSPDEQLGEVGSRVVAHADEHGEKHRDSVSEHRDSASGLKEGIIGLVHKHIKHVMDNVHKIVTPYHSQVGKYPLKNMKS